MRGGDDDEAQSDEFRSIAVPTRRFGDGLIVARPSDGTPLVLPTTAAAVLRAAAGWSSLEGLEAALARTFPDVEPDERRRVLEVLLNDLTSEGLLERR